MDRKVAQTARQTRTDVEDLPFVKSLHLTMRMRGGTPPNGSAAAVPPKQFRIDFEKTVEVARGMRLIKIALAKTKRFPDRYCRVL